ncbi:hypothetical protein Tco_0511406 [Tanacetum coccineum]
MVAGKLAGSLLTFEDQYIVLGKDDAKKHHLEEKVLKLTDLYYDAKLPSFFVSKTDRDSYQHILIAIQFRSSYQHILIAIQFRSSENKKMMHVGFKGMDKSKITRKQSKSSKHGHENQKSTKAGSKARKVKPQSNPVNLCRDNGRSHKVLSVRLMDRKSKSMLKSKAMMMHSYVEAEAPELLVSTAVQVMDFVSSLFDTDLFVFGYTYDVFQKGAVKMRRRNNRLNGRRFPRIGFDRRLFGVQWSSGCWLMLLTYFTLNAAIVKKLNAANKDSKEVTTVLIKSRYSSVVGL